MNPRRPYWHQFRDGLGVMLYVQRVDYSPTTRWEAQPAVNGYSQRRWGRTRQEAIDAAAAAWLGAQQQVGA